MKKFLLITLMLSMVVLGMSGMAFGAAMSSSNIPGGASVAYFQAGAGFTTLINIQSTSATSSILVHVILYDQNSTKIIDFSIPLTALDNVGLAVTGDGATTLTISPYSDNAFGGSGYLPVSVLFGANGTDGLQYGYLTMSITADGNGDRLWAKGNLAGSWTAAAAFVSGVAPVGAATQRLGDPRTFTPFTQLNNGTNQGNMVEPWDVMIVRTAILSADGAIGFNNEMLVRFMNIPILDETGYFVAAPAVAGRSTFVDTDGIVGIAAGAPALDITTACNWDGDNTNGESYATASDDPNGIGIDPWELYLTADSGLQPVAAANTGLMLGGEVAGTVALPAPAAGAGDLPIGVVCDNAGHAAAAVGGYAVAANGAAGRGTYERAVGAARNLSNRYVDALGNTLGQQSTRNLYWARFNEDPTGAETHTTLVAIFPANTGVGVIETRAMSFITYNDDEQGVSYGITPPEVAHLEYGSTVTARPGNGNISTGSAITAGESAITAVGPMFGYSFIEGPAFFDIYPITRATMAMNQRSFSSANCNVNMNAPATGVACDGNDYYSTFATTAPSDILIIP